MVEEAELRHLDQSRRLCPPNVTYLTRASNIAHSMDTKRGFGAQRNMIGRVLAIDRIHNCSLATCDEAVIHMVGSRWHVLLWYLLVFSLALTLMCRCIRVDVLYG